MTDHVLLNRAMARFEVDANGCWLWQGNIKWDGYGRISRLGKEKTAHRVVYEALRGPVPDGLVLDHLCRVRHCVNPDHLRAVTQRVNVLAGVGMGALNALLTHCRRGHPLSGENLYLNSGRRHCRECRAENQRQRLATAKGRAQARAADARFRAKRRAAQPVERRTA